MENRPDRWLYTPLEMIITRSVPPADSVLAQPTDRPNIDVLIQTPLLLGLTGRDAPVERTNLSISIRSYDNAAKITLSDMLRITGAQVANKGYYVRTSSTTSVHGFNKEFYTSDAFLQLPANSLGTDYYAITYEPSLLYTELAVVALYSDTLISIQLLPDLGDTDIPRLEVEWDGRTYSNGDTIRLRLQAFQVAQIQSEQDLTGTHVTSNYPVAFYSGNVRTWIRDDVRERDIQSRDHLVEQIPPTDTWGTRFVAMNYPPHTGEDRIHVVASQPDTIVDMTIIPTSDGRQQEETSRFTLVRPGTSYQIRLRPNTRISLVASKPVMVAHLTHSQMADYVPADELSDPSLIYVVPVDQFDNEYVTGTSDYVGDGNFTTFIVLTVKEGLENSLILDGRPLIFHSEPPRWRSISIRGDRTAGEPAMVNYVQGYVKISPGVHQVRSDATTFGAVLWAKGDRNTIAFPLGMRWSPNKVSRFA